MHGCVPRNCGQVLGEKHPAEEGHWDVQATESDRHVVRRPAGMREVPGARSATSWGHVDQGLSRDEDHPSISLVARSNAWTISSVRGSAKKSSLTVGESAKQDRPSCASATRSLRLRRLATRILVGLPTALSARCMAMISAWAWRPASFIRPRYGAT